MLPHSPSHPNGYGLGYHSLSSALSFHVDPCLLWRRIINKNTKWKDRKANLVKAKELRIKEVK